jgi:hypothetical protein
MCGWRTGRRGGLAIRLQNNQMGLFGNQQYGKCRGPLAVAISEFGGKR